MNDWEIPCSVCGTLYFNAEHEGNVYCHVCHPLNPKNRKDA